MIPPPIQLRVTAWQDALEMNVLYSVQASLTAVQVWEYQSMMPPPIQFHVTAWQDALETDVLYFVQAFLTGKGTPVYDESSNTVLCPSETH